MGIINEKYNIDKDMLYPYQNTLRELVTEDENFIQQYKNNADIQFSDDSKNKFIRFQQEQNHLFNEIIIKINDFS